MQDDMDMGDQVVTLSDETGRAIACTVEQVLEIDEQEYALLLPVDAPVEIVAYADESEDAEAIPVEDDAEIDTLFSVAKAVLEEQNLTLKRTAIFLTVEGDLPDLDEEDFADDMDSMGEDEGDELLFLANFFHEGREFEIYTPLDPYFLLARVDAANQLQLLSPEELERLQPHLSAVADQLLLDELESADSN